MQHSHLRTEPQVLSQTAHLADTGRFPSIHWWGIVMFCNRKNVYPNNLQQRW